MMSTETNENPAPKHIAILGLEKAGKTVIGNYLVTGVPAMDFRPTLGISISNLLLQQMKHQLMDYPGQKSLRKAWETYIEKVNVIIFVVDTAHPLRISEIDEEFKKLVRKPIVMKSPILFVFHKIDLPEAESGLSEFKAYFNETYFSENLCADVETFETTIYNPESIDLVKKVLELKLLENFSKN